MTFATGPFKFLTYKQEVTFGVLPVAAAAQALRRLTSDLSLTKDTYASNEVRTDFQNADFRHGVRRVSGKISGEISPGTYKDFFAAALKRDFAVGTPLTGTSVTIGAPTGNIYPFTNSTGSMLTNGFKVGMVVRLSVGGFNAANINKNILITDIPSATTWSGIPVNNVALVPEGPILTSTITMVGKSTYIPLTGHTDRSFSIEHWFSDIAQSEAFSGVKIDKISISLPPTGLATADFDLLGQNVTTAAAQYFTTPTSVSTSPPLAAVNGIVRAGGTTYASLTGLTTEIDPTFTGDPVVGSNVVSNLLAGKVMVTGQFTAYFENAVLRDAFINETEIDLVGVYTTDNTATADFIAIAIPRLKLGSASKNDGNGGIIQTFQFTALMNVNGGVGIKTEKSTIQIQDSLA